MSMMKMFMLCSFVTLMFSCVFTKACAGGDNSRDTVHGCWLTLRMGEGKNHPHRGKLTYERYTKKPQSGNTYLNSK